MSAWRENQVGAEEGEECCLLVSCCTALQIKKKKRDEYGRRFLLVVDKLFVSADDQTQDQAFRSQPNKKWRPYKPFGDPPQGSQTRALASIEARRFFFFFSQKKNNIAFKEEKRVWTHQQKT